MIIETKNNGSDKPKTPTGLQQAVCSKIADIGMQETTYNGEKKFTHKCIFLFELAARIETGEYTGQRFIITKRYTVSLFEKSTLTKDITSWRGKPLTDQERKLFNTDELLGKNCVLTIGEREYEGRSFPEITAISPLMDTMKPIAPELEKLPDWIQKLVDEKNNKLGGDIKPTEEIPF